MKANIKFTNSSDFTKKLKPNKCYVGSTATSKKRSGTCKKKKIAKELMDELEEEFFEDEDYI